MELSEKVIEASHAFWIKIKLLHILIEYLGNIIDLSSNNESCLDVWKVLTSRIEDIYNFLMKENIIIKISDSNCKSEIWTNYELLIDSLAKLLLFKDYNIVSNFDDFVSDIIDLLIYFENELKSIFKNI